MKILSIYSFSLTGFVRGSKTVTALLSKGYNGEGCSDKKIKVKPSSIFKPNCFEKRFKLFFYIVSDCLGLSRNSVTLPLTDKRALSYNL